MSISILMLTEAPFVVLRDSPWDLLFIAFLNVTLLKSNFVFNNITSSNLHRREFDRYIYTVTFSHKPTLSTYIFVIAYVCMKQNNKKYLQKNLNMQINNYILL